MQGNVVCGQHADAQTRRQRRVQEIANQSLVLNKQQQKKLDSVITTKINV